MKYIFLIFFIILSVKLYSDESSFGEKGLPKTNVAGFQILGEAGLGGIIFSHQFSHFAINYGGGFPGFPFLSLSGLIGSYEKSFEATVGFTMLVIPFVGIGYRYSEQKADSTDSNMFLRFMLYLGYFRASDDVVLFIPYIGTSVGFNY